ncbi:MAG: hypothetical protein ACOZNI_32630 [Myxococcota bacterium]
MLLLLCTHAAAGTVEVWTYDDFPSEQYIDGRGGWEAGFEYDPWYGYQMDDGAVWALPVTDNNTDDYPGDWGEGGPLDNWLVNEAETVGDGVFSAIYYSRDDDPLGIVVAHADGETFYMFVLCGAEGAQGNCPFDIQSGTSAIVRLSRGEPEVLDLDRASFDMYGVGDVSFSLNDGVLTATSDELGIEMSVEDDTYDSVNAVGFWAYDAGIGAGDTDTWVAFGEPVLYAHDDDDDGVIDDADLCEFEHASTDADGDGCEDEADADTDTDADTDADSDTDTDTDTDTDDTGKPAGGGGDKAGGLQTAGGCSCDGGTSGLVGLAPLLLAAGAARRRRG